MSAVLEGTEDIICNKFSISMGGKTLFKDSKLSLIHGRRYGLIGACPACQQQQTRAKLTHLGWGCSGRSQRLR